MSANLLRKSGMKLVLEYDKLINSNQFWGFCWEKVLECSNLVLIIINNKTNSFVYVESFNMWNARLAHLNFKSLKFMSKNSLLFQL